MQKIGVLGSGVVGQTLANGFLKHGFEVMRGSREPGKLQDWKQSAGAKASVGTFEETARFGEMVVVAVKGNVAEAVIGMTVNQLDGKIVIDTTNPIADAPPVNGVIKYFTGPNESLMERLQKAAPKARFVKAFSSVGNAFMVNPDFGGIKPTMFICGNDPDAKNETTNVLTTFGGEVSDMGTVEGARAIEPLCMLWCIPGIRGGGWAHAFKLLKK